MKFSIPAVVLAALMLLGVSCSKKPEAPVQQTVDIGVVDLNNGAENRVELKNGGDVITASSSAISLGHCCSASV